MGEERQGDSQEARRTEPLASTDRRRPGTTTPSSASSSTGASTRCPAGRPRPARWTRCRSRLGWRAWFRDNAYAEWYANTLKIPGSPTAAHHRATYGDASYDDFAPTFNEAIRAWDAGRLGRAVPAGRRRLRRPHHQAPRRLPPLAQPRAPPDPRRLPRRPATSSGSWPGPSAPPACASGPTTPAASTGASTRPRSRTSPTSARP